MGDMQQQKIIRIKMLGKEENVALSENILTESTIKSMFLLPADAVVKLWYEVDGIKIVCKAKMHPEPCFILPDGYIEFNVESNKAPSRSATPIDTNGDDPFEVEKENRIEQVLSKWNSCVFRIYGRELQGTCVLIDNHRVLTAAHLSFKLNESYEIKGVQHTEFTVKCVFISKNYDFAILHSDDLPNHELEIGSLSRGHKYYKMGYPNGVDHSKPTITKGTIEGLMKDLVHLVGTPGSARGYSGAPVFNDSARLAGILLGGTSKLTPNTTIQECMDSSAEQKYARILGIGTIKAFCSFKGYYSDSES